MSFGKAKVNWNERENEVVRSSVGLVQSYWENTAKTINRASFMMYPVHSIVPNVIVEVLYDGKTGSGS